MRTLLFLISLFTSCYLSAATINDYMHQHNNLQSHPEIMSMILDWVNDPVNKDAKEDGYTLAQDMVTESAHACLAGMSSLSNEDCQAVVYAAGDR